MRSVKNFVPNRPKMVTLLKDLKKKTLKMYLQWLEKNNNNGSPHHYRSNRGHTLNMKSSEAIVKTIQNINRKNEDPTLVP